MRSKKKPDDQGLYFVIEGGINRTKNATVEAALAHAKVLLEQRNEVAGKVVLGVDAASGSDQTVIHVMDRGRPLGYINRIESPAIRAGKSMQMALAYALGENATPRIERKQCVKNTAPLYIVKVVAVVEQEAPRVKVRQPKGDELPE